MNSFIDLCIVTGVVFGFVVFYALSMKDLARLFDYVERDRR